MEDQIWLHDALIFLILAGVVVPIFHRFRLGTVLGFIFAGLLVGPYGLGRLQLDVPIVRFLVISDPHQVEPFAEFGVVFLLFVLGLELSFKRLWEMKRYVLGVGTAQALLTMALVAGAAVLLGQSGPVSIVLGLALALSSTAIVMQILVEERRLASTTGRLSLSILLMQDLMVVPALITVSLLARPDADLVREIGLAIVEATIAVAAILVIGRFVLRPLLRQAALTGSRELIMAIVLFAIVGAAIGTDAAGLSAELGAFLAGLLLAESEYRHQIEVDLDPFKGLLLGLFFITVGMSIDLLVVAELFLWIVPAVAGLVALKAATAFLAARLFAVPVATAAETGILLSQAGEFGFVIFALASSNGILTTGQSQFFIVVVGLTMAVTPFLATLSRKVGARLETAENDAMKPGAGEAELSGHVVIGGFGRVGRTIARVLEAENVPFVALDQNARLVGSERKSGRHIFFGDAGRGEILDRAGADQARAFIVTVDSPQNAEHMVRAVSQRRPDAPVYARARDADHARALRRLGADVVPEAVEGSLQLAGRVLAGLGYPEDAVQRRIDQEREIERLKLESGQDS